MTWVLVTTLTKPIENIQVEILIDRRAVFRSEIGTSDQIKFSKYCLLVR